MPAAGAESSLPIAIVTLTEDGHSTSLIGCPSGCSTQCISMPMVSPWRNVRFRMELLDCQSVTNSFLIESAQRTMEGSDISKMGPCQRREGLVIKPLLDAGVILLCADVSRSVRVINVCGLVCVSCNLMRRVLVEPFVVRVQPANVKWLMLLRKG